MLLDVADRGRYDPRMRAIVLVGGEGTRMRPLTLRTPKQLAPVANRPLLEHLLLRLRVHGVERVTLALMERNEAIRSAFGDGAALGLELDYSYEDEPLGSGGAIGQAAAGWDEPFFVCNGDIVTEANLSAMRETHAARHAELSILLHEVEDPTPFGVVDLDGDGRIRRFVEKPPRAEAPSRLINAGVWLFEPSLLPRLPADRFHMVERGLFPELAAEGAGIYGFDDGGVYWRDIGNADALLAANLDIAAAERSQRGVLLDAAVEIAAGATVEGPAVIGAGARVEAGAYVTRSVLWPGATIERDARLEDCIVAAGARVGAGAQLRHVVVAHDTIVDPATEHADTALTPTPRTPRERTPA